MRFVSSEPPILVAGASGLLGRTVVSRLLERGLPVRAASRKPEDHLAWATSAGAETCRLDLRTEEDIRSALEGTRAVLLAVQALTPPTADNHPGNVDDEGVRRLIEGAAGGGPGRLVLVSPAVSSLSSPSRYLRLRAVVERVLERSGVLYSIVRAATFMESAILAALAIPLKKGMPIHLRGSGKTPLNFVSVENVADVVVESLLRTDSECDRIGVGGPDTLSRRDALAYLERRLGRRADVVTMKPESLQVMRGASGMLNPGVNWLADHFLAEESRPDHFGWQPDPIRDHVGPRTLDEVVRAWAEALEGES